MKLIDKYLPSDYRDSVSKKIKPAEQLTPDSIFEDMFCHLPKFVDWLMKMRNALVKPLGLQGGSGFRNLIFRVGIYCSHPESCRQEATVTTVVKFNNFVGKLYFIGI